MFRAALARQEAPWKSSTADITSSIRGWELSVSLTTLSKLWRTRTEFSTERGKKSLRQGIYARALTSSLSEFTAVWTAKPSGWANGCAALAFPSPLPKSARAVSPSRKRFSCQRPSIGVPLGWAGLKGRDPMPRPAQYLLTSSLISWLEHVLPHHSLNQFESFRPFQSLPEIQLTLSGKDVVGAAGNSCRSLP